MKKYRFSTEREKIYKVLCSTKSHPTAEWILEQLNSQGEKISLATVYRNLTILCEQGRAKKLEVQGAKHAHFDADMTPHHHFVCRKNGKIRDYQIPGKKLDVRLDYYAVCSACI